MKNRLNLRSVLMMLAIVVLLTGCGASGTKILIKTDQYKPAFSAKEFSHYHGKRAVLASFHNQAANTTSWGYSSADKKFFYEGNERIESYFQTCFDKAFRHVGVRMVDYEHDANYAVRYWWGVSSYRPPRGVSEFQLILTSVTDQEFKFRALVFRDGETKLDKEMTVISAAATTDVPAELEKRSYRLVDQVFVTILRDRDFRKVF